LPRRVYFWDSVCPPTGIEKQNENQQQNTNQNQLQNLNQNQLQNTSQNLNQQQNTIQN
jgi:hypothetical protein